jgi:HTH-type transcriptional regulator, sugar sensing transcriptional regulator
MNSIPTKLIDSLKELGLLESEAKIYSALVLRHDSEVKELQEFLGMSKPSVYEGLRTLEEKGFVILTNPKPTTYQAIPPEIALDMRLASQTKAKEEALASIHELESEQGEDRVPESLWFIFGTRHFESKVKDMLKSAKKSIYCVTAGHGLDMIERKARSDLTFDLTVITDDESIKPRLEGVFKKNRLSLRTISKSKMMESLMSGAQGSKTGSMPSKEKLLGMYDMDKMFILLVDDEELFYIPPIKGGSLNAISTRNQVMVQNMKFMNMLKEGETHDL